MNTEEVESNTEHEAEQKPVILDRLDIASTSDSTGPSERKPIVQVKQEIKTEIEDNTEEIHNLDSKESVQAIIRNIKTE